MAGNILFPSVIKEKTYPKVVKAGKVSPSTEHEVCCSDIKPI